jgi:hypothetical protein
MVGCSCRREGYAYHSPDAVRFLRVLLRKIRGKLLVIWDGSPIHRGQPIKDFLRRDGARGVHLERLPGYAPDLNLDEGIWNYSSVLNSAISAAMPWPSWPWPCAGPKSGCATSARSSRHASNKLATVLSSSCEGQ